MKPVWILLTVLLLAAGTGLFLVVRMFYGNLAAIVVILFIGYISSIIAFFEKLKL